MKINAILNQKEDEYNPTACVIEHITILDDAQFSVFRNNLLCDYAFIEENREWMYEDENGTLHAILALNEDTGDGILIESSGFSYARYSSYVPCILPHIVEQVQTVCEAVFSEAVFDMKKQFDIEEISQQYEIPLREGNGFDVLFATCLKEMQDIEHLEFFDDGKFEITLDRDCYPEHNQSNEMEVSL